MFEQKNNVTNVHGTKVLNNEKIYKNYLKCSIIFSFYQTKYMKNGAITSMEFLKLF